MNEPTNNFLAYLLIGLGIAYFAGTVAESMRKPVQAPKQEPTFKHNPHIEAQFQSQIPEGEGCVIFLQTPYGVLPFVIDAAQLEMARSLAEAENKPIDVILCEVLAERIEIARNLDL